MSVTALNAQRTRSEMDRMQEVFQSQRRAFDRDPMPSAEVRRENLRRLKAAILRYQGRLADAVNEDFGCRSRDETMLADIMPTVSQINYQLKNVRRWMKPERRHVGAAFQPAKAFVQYQPLGVVGIIAPCNYPIQLVLEPLATALAAGNRAMIKVSEFTPATNKTLEAMLGEVFPEDHVAMVHGEAEVAQAFTRLPFDHLLFTGSTAVGRQVMRAAAEHLTPVTLELGGKSPATVSDTVPLDHAAERIAFGKALNAGQTCIAPDYVLCPADRVDGFVEAFQRRVSRMYPTLRDNPDFTAIVNDRQYERLTRYLRDAREKGARIVEINPASEKLEDVRKLPLTLLLDTTEDMLVRQEEIFGPLLPVVPYDSLDEALEYVRRNPRPLALYYFDYDKQRQRRVLEQTHAGGVSINDTLSHIAQDDLPFGGIVPSGIGRYHGKEGFLTFSHAKSVYVKPRFNGARFAYPPYGLVNKLIYRLFIR